MAVKYEIYKIMTTKEYESIKISDPQKEKKKKWKKAVNHIQYPNEQTVDFHRWDWEVTTDVCGLCSF